MQRELLVNAGRVGCPRRGDADIDHCFICPDLMDVREDPEGLAVLCRARGRGRTVFLPFAG